MGEPLRYLSFCSQPLYGLQAMQAERPHALEDWLEYHLGFAGFELGDIYDLDGSFAQAMDHSYLSKLKGLGKLRYRSFWPRNLSSRLEALSAEHPYCTETWAYAHCLTTQRAESRFVLLLHAPDEYVFAHSRPKAHGLRSLLRIYEQGMPPGEPVMMLRVAASSFARDGNDGFHDELVDRGRVVAASRQRSDLRYVHTPLVDPFLSQCAGPHTCYSESDAPYPAWCRKSTQSTWSSTTTWRCWKGTSAVVAPSTRLAMFPTFLVATSCPSLDQRFQIP